MKRDGRPPGISTDPGTRVNNASADSPGARRNPPLNGRPSPADNGESGFRALLRPESPPSPHSASEVRP